MKKTIRKTIILLSIFSMLAFLSACGNTNLEGTVADSLTDKNDTHVAKVIIGGEETLYESMAEAWSAVNASVDQDSEMILLTDWVAEDGVFGSGDGYGETGNLTPKDRNKDSIKLTIDLNGFTIDRNLQEHIKSGNIISLKKDGIFTIMNGTLTGGNTTDRGGAVWMDNDETTVYLENLNIIGNYAQGVGGAIFCKDSYSRLYITDSTITDNVSEKYGGAIYIQGQPDNMFDHYHYTDLYLRGTVVIKNNTGKDNRNNLCLQQQQGSWDQYLVMMESVTDLKEGSEIYIAPSDFGDYYLVSNKGNNNLLKAVKDYFHSDNPNKVVTYDQDNGYEYLYEKKK